MNYITLTLDNIDNEHICCALSNNKDIQVVSKKNWLKERIKDGLVFVKADLKGKCFIEYIPSEYSFAPIDASNYMYIDCFWVSGSYKGKGYSNDLLDICINDAKNKNKDGLCIVSSNKKKGFLIDSSFLIHKGFMLCDKADPYFELYYLPFNDNSIPKFKSQVKNPKINEEGFVLYYTNACPFCAKYVPIIKQRAIDNGYSFKDILIDNCKDAQNAPSAWCTFALFYNGNFITHEILSLNKMQKIIDSLGE